MSKLEVLSHQLEESVWKIKQQIKAHFKIILMDKSLVLSTELIMKIGHVLSVSPLY